MIIKLIKKIILSIFSRRSSQRVIVALPMIFKIIAPNGTESEEVRATTSDISTYGLSFLIKTLRIGEDHLWFNDSLSKRNIMQLALRDPDTGTNIYLKGEICYFTRLDDYDKNYKIGINFIDVDNDQKTNLNGLIKKYAHKK